MAKSKSSNAAGFAAVELVLVIVILAGIVGLGAYVMHQRSQKSTAAIAPSGTAAQVTVKPPLNGSTASIDQLSTQAAQSEASADNAGDTQAQQASGSANATAGNVGGAYDENNL